MGLSNLFDDGGDAMKSSDSEEGCPEDSVIESIIREAMQANSGEISVIKKEDLLISNKIKAKGKRVAYSVSCVMCISGSDYQVQLLPSSSDYDKGYRLNKINAQKPVGYNVIQKDGEITCECADFMYRSSSVGCKHIRGLVDLGMFSVPPLSERMSSGVFDD